MAKATALKKEGEACCPFGATPNHFRFFGVDFSMFLCFFWENCGGWVCQVGRMLGELFMQLVGRSN